MKLNIPEQYEQEPKYAILRFDGKYTYVFPRKDNPNAALIVVDGEVLDWTAYLQGQMLAGLIKKK